MLNVLELVGLRVSYSADIPGGCDLGRCEIKFISGVMKKVLCWLFGHCYQMEYPKYQAMIQHNLGQQVEFVKCMKCGTIEAVIVLDKED